MSFLRYAKAPLPVINLNFCIKTNVICGIIEHMKWDMSIDVVDITKKSIENRRKSTLLSEILLHIFA